MNLQHFDPIVDLINQADSPRQAMHQADAARGEAADSRAQFIVDVGRTKHRFSLGRPVDVTKTVLNSALAISQFPLSNLVHSKCPPLSSLKFLRTQL